MAGARVTEGEAQAGALPREVEVAIVGAGFGGLGAAIRLRQEGVEDFVVLERAEGVGGTWFANTYPGCQCDVPSNLYSFSFARKPDWTRSYPEQPQILDYLRDCVRRFGLEPKVHLRCELLSAAWHEGAARWRIETSQGELSARALIAAPGLLSEPRTPDLPGLDRFEGACFHSARWDHGQDLAGKRVAVVGTGASAIQIVPRIQPEAAKVHVFQRTPPWVLPHADRPIGPRLHRLYRRAPRIQRLARAGVYWLRETYVIAFTRSRLVMKGFELQARLHLRRQVSDRELRRKLTPDYPIGCKRVLLSDDWFPAVSASNAELVTAGVSEVRERSVVATDGSEREVDAIVLATGFSPTNPPIARRLRGRGGRLLADAWRDGMRAYLGTTVAGFPNLFLLYGPNTNLAHSSIVFMMESQTAHVLDALRWMRAQGVSAVEPRRKAQDDWNDEVQRALAPTVWNGGGCASWYLDERGDNPIMWPDFTFRFRARTRRFEPAAYVVERAPGAGRATAAPAPAA